MVNDSTKFLREELGVPHSSPDKFGGLTYKVYQGMGHATNPTELDDLKNFIMKAIPALTE
jgi:lysophospholipase I